MKLKNEENVFLTEIKNAKRQNKQIYVLGAAQGGVRIANGLKHWGLDLDAFIVDAPYYKAGEELLGKPIFCVDDVVGKDSVVICSIANYPKMEQLKQKTYVVDEDVLSLSMAASDPFDDAFVKRHMDELELLYNALGDEKSRQVMDAYINQKLTGRFEEMKDVWDTIQYFDGDFYQLENVHSIVDCGAFVGDSFLSFCEEYHKRAGRKFDGTAYLLDPDHKNQMQISKNCREYKDNIEQLQVGAWCQRDKLHFQMDGNKGNAGKIDVSGGIEIQVDAIDNLVSDKVDFIKMDIEGAELSALQGAAQAIKRDHPILAICVYHKREDLIEIPGYIQELYGDYKFYLRAYGGPYSIELVLYAVADK